VNHGYGNKYNYQAVFTPIGTTEPTPTGGATATPTGIGGLSTDTAIEIGLVAVIIILLICIRGIRVHQKKQKVTPFFFFLVYLIQFLKLRDFIF
jgi:hypothetical protein